MKSIELNKDYYFECIQPILKKHCPGIAENHAAALIGWGSEVLGNDDEHSKKYGWGPRVVIFLNRKDHPMFADDLYNALRENVPLAFKGSLTRFTDPMKGPPMQTEDKDAFLMIPITTIERFLEIYLGIGRAVIPEPKLSDRDWLRITEEGLLRLTDGAVYFDGKGLLTRVRAFFKYLPENVLRYKLVYQWDRLDRNLQLIGLCGSRGDFLSSSVAKSRAVEHIISIIFLLNRVYQPGYLKQWHRQFIKLPLMANDIKDQLHEIMTCADYPGAMGLIYPVLDQLIHFQNRSLNLSIRDFRHPGRLDRGFFDYELFPIIDGLKKTINGELSTISNPIGAFDQWLSDQVFLLSPAQLKPLDMVYDMKDSFKAFFANRDVKEYGL